MGHQPNTTNPGTRLNGTGAILESEASDTVIKCAECGTESPLNVECEYCHKTFCEKHMPEHKAWEHRHENLAEDSSRLWKRRRESP
jgi:predicted nucleic acid binding AN1-type Zn finger protein